MIKNMMSAAVRPVSTLWSRRMIHSTARCLVESESSKQVLATPVEINDGHMSESDGEQISTPQATQGMNEKGINHVTLMGRCGNVPEVRGSEDRPVVLFNLGTSHSIPRGDDYIRTTDWHRIAVFKPSLRNNVSRFLEKGQRVLVQGRLGYVMRYNAETNNTAKIASVVADEVVFLEKPRSSNR